MSVTRVERVAGIEPASSAWKAEVIATIPYPPMPADLASQHPLQNKLRLMVVRGGFEPPKLARQIYSLIPLATREPHHNHFIAPTGAGTRSRTQDLLITSQLLYQLSYTGLGNEVGRILLIAPGPCNPFTRFFFNFYI